MSITFKTGVPSLSGYVGEIDVNIGVEAGGIISPYVYYSSTFPFNTAWKYWSLNDAITRTNSNITQLVPFSVRRADSFASSGNRTIALIPMYNEQGQIELYCRIFAVWSSSTYIGEFYIYFYRDFACTQYVAGISPYAGGLAPEGRIRVGLCAVQNTETGITDGVAIYVEIGTSATSFTHTWAGQTPILAIINRSKFKATYGADFVISERSPEAGEISTGGGYTGGTFDDSSDTIAIPTAPTMGVTSAGFINVYSPSQGELVQFGAELFPDLSFTPVSQGGSPASVTDALVAMAQVLVDFGNQIPAFIDMYINANLIQYVIDCHILPVAPTTMGTSPLKVGFKTFSQTPAKVISDYVDFDCGTLNVGEYYANFADYSPYTSAKLYLPFVGFMDIAPEYWQSGTLQVIYRFNVIDGSFVAYVKSTSSKSKLSDTVIAQFGGNACVHIPITGLNYASMVSGIVSAVSPLLPSAKANVGTVDKLVNSANTIASAKPTMQQSNGYNATTSFLTVRFPYLLIERSVSNYSRDFANENGIPCNITCNFSSLSGLTKATMLHLDGIAGATEDDLDEIASLLAEGVIL